MKSSFWANRRVFVTGATGLVGSWLVKDLLNHGAYVVVLIRDHDPQSELIRSGDINKTSVVNGALEDYATLERAINENEISAVFHLGAQPIVGAAQRNPLPTLETNIRGTYNLLEACRVHRNLVNQIVVASSDKAYGESGTLPYTEDMPLKGVHPYEVSKTCTDLITQSYASSYKLPATIARCGNIYGGGDLNWSRIVPGTIRSFLSGEAPVIRSDGKFIRDYIYVEDVAAAYLQLGQAINERDLTGEAFNFSPESPLTVLELVELIAKIMKTSHLKPIIQNQAQGEIISQYLDSSKAASVLGWRTSFNHQSGMEKTITWYRNYLNTLQEQKCIAP
ncbi:MAG: NAD-dependent epimerase/dehydratase family protein [Candidatus Obscuribacterales bacterium]|nr:NAD-dependent epimerase/dehydratase family protein [Candidatus Obscuribacterales bacterium]